MSTVFYNISNLSLIYICSTFEADEHDVKKTFVPDNSHHQFGCRKDVKMPAKASHGGGIYIQLVPQGQKHPIALQEA